MTKTRRSIRAWTIAACIGGLVACGGKVAPDGLDDGSDSDPDSDFGASTGGSASDGEPPRASTGGSIGRGGNAGPPMPDPPLVGSGGTLGAGGGPNPAGGAAGSGQAPAEILHRICQNICTCSGFPSEESCVSDCASSVAPAWDCSAASPLLECIDSVMNQIGACSPAFGDTMTRTCGPQMTRYSRECVPPPPVAPPPVEPPLLDCPLGISRYASGCTVETDVCRDGNSYRIDCSFAPDGVVNCTCWNSVRGDAGAFTVFSEAPYVDFCDGRALEHCELPVTLPN